MANKWYQDSDGNTSGKRIFGAVGFSLYILTGIGLSVFSVYTGNDLGVNVAGILGGIGMTSGGLLGIGVVEKLRKS